MQEILLNGINLNELLGHFSKIIDDKLSNLGKPENSKSEYLSRKDVAKILGISLPTLNEWTKAGLISSSKMGNRVYYTRTDIDIALETVSKQKHKKGGLSNGQI